MPTGTYTLLLHLPGDTQLAIGGLGQFNFPAGYYAYVDGAYDADGLTGALKKRLTPSKTPTRHIDYLRQAADIEEIWLTATPQTREHVWSALLLEIPGAMSLIEGFGAADCNCESHLIYFDIRPSLEDFELGVRHLFPEDVIIRAYAKEEAGD